MKYAWILALLLTACGRGYSEGERSGVIFKFSSKGLIWKSWEGEMNLGGMRGAVTNTWKFTLKDDRLLTRNDFVTAVHIDG